MTEAMQIQQLYKIARLVLNVDEGMTDENDVECLDWILDKIGITYTDLDKALLGNWDFNEIDMLIREGD